MTAIAGFTCIDGVMLAADTEETYGDNKVYTHKLFSVGHANWRIGLAGAGVGYLIDYAKDKIFAAVRDDLQNNRNFELRLAHILDRLYEKEFKRYPAESELSRQVQLLIGVQFRNDSGWAKPALFECQSNLVSEVMRGRCRVVGAGELLKEVGSQLASWGLSVDLAEWAGVYLIYDAKRRFGGVGGKTHTVILGDDGKFLQGHGSGVTDKEYVLEGFARISQMLMLSLDPALTSEQFKDLLSAAKKWMGSARRELGRIRRKGKGNLATVVIQSRETRRFMRMFNTAMRSTSQTSEGKQ